MARGELSGLGAFRLEGVLGEGEHATVYEAYRASEAAGGRGVALKLAHGVVADDATAREAFVARAKASMALDHPNVVTTSELGELDRRPYVVMERISGVPLSDMLPRRGSGRFGADAAGHIVHELLGALVAAATATPPLVHGRLDTGNVLIDSDGGVHLASFGTPGDARADFLDLARLAQGLSKSWPVSVDEWLDALQEDRYAAPAAALAAFPMQATPQGRAALARAVKRVVRKRDKAQSRSDQEAGAEAPTPAAPARRTRARTTAGAAQPRTSPPNDRADADNAADALRQARFIGVCCAAVLFTALLIELLLFSG